MATLTLIAPFQTLSINEAVAGYTHKAILTQNDLNAVPASNVTATQIWNLQLLGTGYAVLGTAVYVVTPIIFSNASIIIGSVTVGDGSSPTTFLSGTTAKVQGTGATAAAIAGAGYVSATQVAYPVATNAQLSVTMNITASQPFNTATAGEVHILFKIANLANFAYPQSN